MASSLLSESKNQEIETTKTLWEPLRDATFSHFKQAREIYLSDKRLQSGLSAFIRFYDLFEPGNTDFITYTNKLGDLYNQVKKRYDSAIWKWLNLIHKIEGEDHASRWSRIAVDELDADLPEKFEW